MINKRLYFYALLLLSVFSYAALSTNLLATNVERVSLSDQTGAEADRSSSHASQSADGRYVVFESDSTNLIAGSNPKLKSIYLRDRQTGLTELISVDSNEVQANAESFAPVVSSDGRYVAFHSISNTLVTGDTNMRSDVFLRDRTLGTTTRISVDSLGNQAGGESTYPSISEDGNLITFISYASDLVAGDTNNKADVFLYNRTTGVTTRISVDSGGTEGDDESTEAQISGNGQFVAFSSESTNLVASDTNACRDIFLYEISTGNTSILSTHTNGTFGDRASSQPKISSNGLVVAFSSRAGNLVDTDSNGFRDVFVRDRQSSTTERVSLTSLGSQVVGNSVDPDVSEDGRFVTFSSFSKDYDVNDNNGVTDVFVHDRAANKTILVNQNATNEPGNEESLHPRISNNGSLISFESYSDNLVTGDTNNHKDIFMAENELYKSVVSVTALSATTDEESASTVQFRFQRVDNLDRAITVHFTHTGTALSGTDYVDPGTTIDFPVNVDEVFLDVTITDDVIVEGSETVQFSLVDHIDYAIGDVSNNTTTINETDKHLITVTVDIAVLNEEGEVSGQLTFDRGSANGTLLPVDISYVLSGTANTPLDYLTVGPIIIPSGLESLSIPIHVVDDSLNEGSESIQFSFSSGDHYSMVSGSESVALTILDNDKNLVGITVKDAVATEGDTQDTGIFEVSREGETATDLSVNYIVRGTAVNGGDYNAISGSITIPQGSSSIDLVISALADDHRESSETVIIEVISGELYDLKTNSKASLIIVDQSNKPVASISESNVSVSETNGVVSHTVSIDEIQSNDVVVNLSYGGTATKDLDFTGPNSVTITAGQLNASFNLNVVDDVLIEETESILVAITGGSGYEIDPIDDRTISSIEDNEPSLISVKTLKKTTFEGSQLPAQFELRRSGDLSSSIDVNIQFQGDATLGADYVSPGNIASFPSGVDRVEVNISALSDSGAFEGVERVQLTLNSGSGYQVSEEDEAVIIIEDKPYRLESSLGEPNGESVDVSISGNGNIIAFSSKSSLWVNGDNNSEQDIFFYNKSLDSYTRLLGVSGAEPNGQSQKPVVSRDGKFIVFESFATNLVASQPVDGKKYVYIYDVENNQTQFLLDFMSEFPNDETVEPHLSGDGRYVVFSSKASNLISDDTNGLFDVFFVDREQDTINRVSFWPGGEETTLYNSINPKVSDSGAFVLYEKSYNSSIIYRFDTMTQETSSLYNVGSGTPVISIAQNEAFFLFSKKQNGGDTERQIYAYDLITDEKELISVAEEGQSLNGRSFSASIGGKDGRYITYLSYATNLVEGIEVCGVRAYIHDRLAKRTRLLDKRYFKDCNYQLESIQISEDGKVVVLSSPSSSFIENDTNGAADLFLFGNPLEINPNQNSFLMLVDSFLKWSGLK